MINDFIDYMKKMKILKEFTYMDCPFYFKIHEIQYMIHNIHNTENTKKIIRGYTRNVADL